MVTLHPSAKYFKRHEKDTQFIDLRNLQNLIS